MDLLHQGCWLVANESEIPGHLTKSFVIDKALDIQTPPEVWCFRYMFGVQQVFGCLGNKLIPATLSHFIQYQPFPISAYIALCQQKS